MLSNNHSTMPISHTGCVERSKTKSTFKFQELIKSPGFFFFLRQTSSKEGRLTGRQAGRQAVRHAGRQASRQVNRHTGRQADMQADAHRRAGGQADK